MSRSKMHPEYNSYRRKHFGLFLSLVPRDGERETEILVSRGRNSHLVFFQIMMNELFCFYNKQDMADYCWQERFRHDVEGVLTSVLCQGVQALFFVFSRDRGSLCISIQAILKLVKKVTSLTHETHKKTEGVDVTVPLVVLCHITWKCLLPV